MAFLKAIIGRCRRGLALVSVFSAALTIHAEPVSKRPANAATLDSIHAAFIVNMTRFIQWPDTAFGYGDAPIVIGTFEHDPVNEDLDAAIAGEKVGQRRLVTQRILAMEDLTHCHVVYFSESDPRRSTVLARVAGKPVLTISDGAWLLRLGGDVSFISAPPHMKLRINIANLRASQLQVRAQLLRIAETEGGP